LFSSLKRSVGRHWKVLGLTAVILVALASSAYAYWRINAPLSPTSYATATSPPLELRMELEKTQFQLNETIIVHLFLTNIGSEKVTIIFSYMNYMVGFVVEDENGTKVFEQPMGYLCTIKEVILEPGDQISETLEWHQVCNIHPFDHQPFALGTYRIIGRTGYHSIGGFESLPERFDTPPITITIS
jgi:hypothetical protein